MGRFAQIAAGLGKQSALGNALFGASCASLAVLALALTWTAFRPVHPGPPAFPELEVNSDADIVGELGPDLNRLPPASVSLDNRADAEHRK